MGDIIYDTVAAFCALRTQSYRLLISSPVVQKAHRFAAIGIVLRHSGHSFVVGSGGASPRRIRAMTAFTGNITKNRRQSLSGGMTQAH